MSTSIGKLTVFFEEPFWVGVFERIENGKLSVSKVTFGAEPKDYEIYEFVLKNYNGLRFSPAIETVIKNKLKIRRNFSVKFTSQCLPKELEQNLSRRYNYNMNNANSSVKLKVEKKKWQKKRDYLN